MDFLDRLLDFIEDRIEMPSFFSVGKLGKGEQAAALRPTPSSPISRSLDNSKTYEYSFQILIKDPNQFEAIRLINEITELLDGLPNSAIKSENGSFVFIRCEVYTYPNYLEETDHNEFIYTAMFTAELEGGR